MTLDCYTAVKIGVAFENYGEDAWFGNEGSVAYVTSSKIIWDNGTINKTKGKLIFVVRSKASTTLWLSLFFTSYETLEETDCLKFKTIKVNSFKSRSKLCALKSSEYEETISMNFFFHKKTNSILKLSKSCCLGDTHLAETYHIVVR